MRTEGLQEALLKNPALIDNADRITKMKRVIKAVRNKHYQVMVNFHFLFFRHRNLDLWQS